MPRISKYTKATADEICNRIAEGEPLRPICRDKKIAWRTVYHWLEDHKDFAERFAKARDIGYDAIAEEALEIADDGTNDWMERLDKDGEHAGYEFNKEHVQRSKLRIETRLKLLAKWNPKKYGDKLETTHKGSLPVALSLNGSDVHG